MKKTKILSIGLLAAAAALFAPYARAGNVTVNTGDLLLGFENPNGTGAASDYVVDLGPASYFIGLSAGTYNLTSTLSLGNIAADLSATFGSSWATNSATQGQNVQWGVVGDTGTVGGNTGVGGTFGLPKDTIFLTVAEYTPGGGSTAPANSSASAQNGWLTSINQFETTVSTSGTTANSSKATVTSSSETNAWSTKIPTGFTTGLNVEQPTSGTYIGPTNSELDLYELVDSNATGAGTKLLGSFTLDSSGNLDFTAVPEPSTYAMLGMSGIAILVLYRRRNSAMSRAMSIA